MVEISQATAQIEQMNKAVRNREGKYLTFALGPEEYGLEILKVREIIGYMDITAVPQTPEYVKGVINLRGQVIPVIDLRAKFGMPTAEVTEETCIIVVEINTADRKSSTGIVVDRVQEVLDIAGSDIEDAPQFGSSVETDFILGMGKIGDSVKILLDIDQVLANEDLVFARPSDQSRMDEGQQTQPAQIQQPEPQSEQTEPEQTEQQGSDGEQPESQQTPQEESQAQPTEQAAEGQPQ
ncbi:MAG: chemotaxis protein CheW [Planctomycetota bacterium]|nr:MAG: chemotaxis protein CheW [Planctomycetota bacterium]